MTLPVWFSAEAAAELEDAATWYDERREGLGSDFLDAVDEVIAAVAAWPRSDTPVEHSLSDLEVRRAPIARFPYHLGYLVLEDHVRVLAVAHDYRRPAYWAPRVDS